MSSLPNNAVSKSATATADTMFPIVSKPMWFASVNIHCLTHAAFYGDRTEQEAPVYVNDVVYYDSPTNLNEIYFKNLGAGNNAKLVAVGVLLLDAEKIRLGIPLGV